MAETDCQTRCMPQDGLAGTIFQNTVAAFAVGLVIALWSGIIAGRATCCVVEPAATERINPNTASIPSLMRLPGVGRVRAMDIAKGRAIMPFDTVADLERIRGIGPKTVEKIEPYLTFEEQKPIKGIE